jgi:hypothetical protein
MSVKQLSHYSPLIMISAPERRREQMIHDNRSVNRINTSESLLAYGKKLKFVETPQIIMQRPYLIIIFISLRPFNADPIQDLFEHVFMP